jgi:CspA family cold shock protein
VCQRCGRGFIVTESYLDFLARHGAKIKVPMLCMTCFVKAGPLPKQQGEVKWFNRKKRYGFITAEGGEEVFVHERQILNSQGSTPREGQHVRFHRGHSRKGPEALNVVLSDASDPATRSHVETHR